LLIGFPSNHCLQAGHFYFSNIFSIWPTFFNFASIAFGLPSASRVGLFVTLPAVSTEPWTNRRGIALYFLGNPKSSKSLTDRGLSSLFKKEHTSTYGWANLFFNVGNPRLRFGHVHWQCCSAPVHRSVARALFL
jgi:hypothetical protein